MRNRQFGQLRGVMTKETVDSLDAKPVYRTVKTSRLFEQIVQQVEDSILKGQLKPGDQLPAERDLAQRFGVSRTAVREAVKTLREQRSRIFNVQGGPERGQFHHKRILAAVEQRDSEAAREAMRAHLLQVLADTSSLGNGSGKK